MPNVHAAARIWLELSVEELRAIATLVEDQLFRVKFIDPKMPGYKKNPEQLQAAESALSILKESLKSKVEVNKAKAPAMTFHMPQKRVS